MPEPAGHYLGFRELLLNFEAAGLHRVSPADLVATHRQYLYDQRVSLATPLCVICGSPDTKFVPFAPGELAPLVIVRVCVVCENADEL